MSEPTNDSPESGDTATSGHEAGSGKTKRVIVVGPDGQPIGQVDVPEDAEIEDDESGQNKNVADMVEQPAMVMRIGTMVKQLLEEVRQAPLDEASRARLKEIYQQSIVELEKGLAPELKEELDRLSLPFTEDVVPSESELRIAQAQLVGWLEGLFHGIQTALFAQQMASRVALEQMRGGGAQHALPGGMSIQRPGGQPGGEDHASGQYL
ncbi:uncharacterized protein DUF2587 [Antricoccus suffuscus]|uniref:Bacterial proteasome activator n=1 Tax=Antricoccus suffuscus TaxID=1629062 RepID=A0A2T1A2Y6_9ACTN|nr:bacterial proteasome activator family protein [Antricoccus suffuscus]PRZ42972.1 uncharacterized protein DUF2587 [Antricoccus suffuscus]